jgi:hypothetical protein
MVASLTIDSMPSPHEFHNSELGTVTNKLALTSHQAAHAVLFTNELLCDIIGRLSFEDVLSATGVCKFWRGALKGDQHIQEVLFLKPKGITEVFCDNWRINDLEKPISTSSNDCLVIGQVNPYFDHLCGQVQSAAQGVWFLGPFPKLDQPDGT